MNLYNSVVAR